jgi:NAD(P)-dependent dehydrogenase (short-subunit alcohol dehydrogenase family)
MMTIAGKSVLVVGGTSGIGLATAERLSRNGAHVTVASRSPDRVEQAVALIGGGATGRVLDTTDEVGVETFFGSNAQFDHIVITAAETARGSVKDLPLSDAYAAMNSKFWGTYRVARAVIRSGAISRGGSLTLVSGFLAVHPSKTAGLQGAINAALEALARGLALELAPIRVNTVSPGFIDTPLWGEKSPAEHSAFLDSVAGRLPVGIAGKPDHIAIQIEAFLLNEYVTGSTIYIDGGELIA